MSNQDRIVILAYALGYYINKNGHIISKTGRSLRAKYNKKTYLSVNISVPCKFGSDKKTRQLRLHRLAAYQKFGFRMFKKGIQVRHLDGNPKNTRLSNITLGNQSQNMMDRPKEDRFKHACHAASFNSKLSPKRRKQLIDDLKKGIPYSVLTKKYKLCKGTISYWNSKIKAAS